MSHASPAGAYLVACMIFGLISSKTVIGLPSVIYSKDIELVNFPNNNAINIQNIANRALSNATYD